MATPIAKMCFLHGRRMAGGGGGGSDPSTILGADLHRWFKADGTLWQDSGRTTPATSDGDPVGAWDDASGNGGHATQGTAGARPTLKTSILNALPTIRYDGTDDLLTSTVSAGAAKTVWIVGKVRTPFTNQSFLEFHVQATFYTTGNVWTYYDPNSTIGGTATNWNRVCVRYNSAASADTYLNGASVANIDPENVYSTSTSMKVGSGLFGTVDGDIAEVIVASAAATAQQLSDIDAYLVAKYGL